MSSQRHREHAQRGRIEAIWREHRAWIAAVLRAHCPYAVDVQDLLQEVALIVVKHADTLIDESRLHPWLRTVAVNVARDAGRRLTADRKRVDGLKAEHQANDHRLKGDDRKHITRTDVFTPDVFDALSSLPEHYREPLLLQSMGLSLEQISRVMDLPVTTIQTRTVRARTKLRGAMATQATAQQHTCVAPESRSASS